MKFLIIGDLHGRKPKIHYKDFDVIIVPGDVCSDKKLRVFSNKLMQEVKRHPDKKEGEVEKWLIDKKFGRHRYNNMIKESLQIGNDILRYLDSFGKPVFIVPGNWDRSYGQSKIKEPDKNNYNYVMYCLDLYNGKRINPALMKGLKNSYDCQQKLHIFNEFNIIGYGLDNAPFAPEILLKSKKRKLTKKQFINFQKKYNAIFDDFCKKYALRNKNNPTIFLSHNVPYNTQLDVVLKKKSWAYKKHYGSYFARQFILKYQPLICIGGHMHEHFDKCKIGKTVCVNSGYGSLVNVLLEVVDGRIKRLEFWKGEKK